MKRDDKKAMRQKRLFERVTGMLGRYPLWRFRSHMMRHACFNREQEYIDDSRKRRAARQEPTP